MDPAHGTQCDTDHSAGSERGTDTKYTAKSAQLIAGTFRKQSCSHDKQVEKLFAPPTEELT